MLYTQAAVAGWAETGGAFSSLPAPADPTTPLYGFGDVNMTYRSLVQIDLQQGRAEAPSRVTLRQVLGEDGPGGWFPVPSWSAFVPPPPHGESAPWLLCYSAEFAHDGGAALVLTESMKGEVPAHCGANSFACLPLASTPLFCGSRHGHSRRSTLVEQSLI